MKKYKGIVLLLCCLVAVLLALNGYQLFRSPDYSIISTEQELRMILETSAEDQVILDLRKTRDYEQSHIIGARSAPYKDIDDGEAFERYLSKNLLRFKNIYLYCYSGKKSAEAYNLLIHKGYRHVHAITIGYEDYIAEEGNDYSEGEAVCEPCKEKKEDEKDE